MSPETTGREANAEAASPPRAPAPPSGSQGELQGRPRRLGPYVIDAELGRGSQGVVWRGHDERLGRKVALKSMNRAALQGDGLHRLVREARLLARLNHPHLVTVHDLPDFEGTPVLVMELLGGEDLSERLKRGPLGQHEAVRLGAQVASGLEAAHELGIIHGDLKPANLRVLESGDVKILDFGLARQVGPSDDAAAGPDTPEGTFAYMSPEQVRGERLDARSDLFAAGTVLYESLAGARPYTGRSIAECCEAILRREPDWSKLPNDTGPGVRDVLQRCLAKAPEARPVSASALREALERATDPVIASSAAAAEVAVPVEPPHALPAERNEFVGRERELAALQGMAEDGARLISVLGVGGCGKTRLVTRHAADSLGSTPGGVWFCPIAEAHTLQGIVQAVAFALGVQLGRDDPVQRLGHAIAGRGPCVIVLDNFEQAVAHAEASLGHWLDRCPEARFVVTSRERLGLRGEALLTLEALPVEPEGMDLFASRARVQAADFRIDDDNRADVRDVVELLDGLPLAIELAAARTRLLSPAMLKERLSDRFNLLVRKRGSGERQSTLRATIDWSWNMLEAWEQAALAQCSAFEGGFTLEAADEVLDLSAHPTAPWALDLVQLLVDKSLLRTWTVDEAGVGPVGAETYFGMYVSINAYASERLRADAAAQADCFKRHGDFFARMGSRDAISSLERHGGTARRRAIGHALENLTVACQRASARDDSACAVATLRALWQHVQLAGPPETARSLGQPILGLPSLQRRDRADLDMVLAGVERQAGNTDRAVAHAEAALGSYRELGDRSREPDALKALGILNKYLGRHEQGLAQCEEALALYRELGATVAEGSTLSAIGTVQFDLGRMKEARASYDAALAIHREVGNRLSEGKVLGSLATLDRHENRRAEAHAAYEASLAVARELGNRSDEGIRLANLGNLLLIEARLTEAREHYEAALEILRETGDRRVEGVLLGNFGYLLKDLGHLVEAGKCFDSALAIHREVGARAYEGMELSHLAQLRELEGAPAEARGLCEAALAIHREVGDRLNEGQTLMSLARLQLLGGRHAEARESFELALALHDEVGDGMGKGLALGWFGLLEARDGKIAEGREALSQGEELLRERNHPVELGSLLCTRGLVDLMASDRSSAREALDEVRTIASELQLGEASPVGRAIAELEAALPNES